MLNVMHRYLTPEEQSLLMRTIASFSGVKAMRDAAWIDLLKLTGFRIGEFSRLTVKAARLALQTGWLFIPKEHRKGFSRGRARDHSIPVTDPIRQRLTQLLKLQQESFGTGADDEPLIYSRRGRAMSIRGYQDRFKLWCRRASLHATPHFMRHTRAMDIMRRSTSNDPRGLVQASLGHTTVASTGIYTGISKEQLQEGLREVDGVRRPRRRQMRRIFEGRV